MARPILLHRHIWIYVILIFSVCSLPLNIDLPYLHYHHILIASWVLLWNIRNPRDPTLWQDMLLFVSFQLFSPILSILPPWTAYFPILSGLILLPTTAIACLGVLALGRILPSLPRNTCWSSQDCTYPLLHQCRTTHTRMFPKKHGFGYHYLQVSIPVAYEGTYGLVSVGDVPKKGWFHVQASDYLERDSKFSTLEGKLISYLRSQGVEDSQWHHSYLVTAPRFLGYSFNPVSFWYIYDMDENLAMMVLEVNNTFDERRMYLLKANGLDDMYDKCSPFETGKSPRFTNSWEKDFHVSPFNSRKGHYSLSACDPFRSGRLIPPGIDNTIVLRSSKGHVKLVARICSESQPIDPLRSSWCDKSIFIAGWCWLGLFTFPRIVKEAAHLFFNRKLHVWFRPEIAPTSVGRRETHTERILESYFVFYLERLARNSKDPVQIIYKPGFNSASARTIIPQSFKESKIEPQSLELKILNPAFFTRFVHYKSLATTLDLEGVRVEEKNRTIYISRPDLLLALLKAEDSLVHEVTSSGLRWKLLSYLRCPPPEQSYPEGTQTMDIQLFSSVGLSKIDQFMLSSAPDAWLYRRIATKLFLARRFAAGIEEVMDLADTVLRILLFSLFSSAKAALWHDDDSRLLQTSNLHLMPSRIFLVISLNLVHLWATFKGQYD